MIKSSSALRLGGALAIALAVFLVLSACAESSKTPDETVDYTVEVRLTKQDVLATKSLTVTNDNYDLSYTTSALYWTYTAVKKDGYFTTGQTSSETWLDTTASTDEEGNETTEVKSGIPSSLPGKFSVGDWSFTFNAYTSADMSTDDDNDGTPDSLYYQGVETGVSFSSGSDNTVSVQVQLYQAIGETGTLVLKNITLPSTFAESHAVTVTATSSEGTETVSDTMIYTYDSDSADYTVSSSSEDEDAVVYDIEGDTGCELSLAIGNYTVTIDVYTYSSDGSLSKYVSIETSDVLIRPNLDTTIEGDLDVSDITYNVSTTEALASLLSVDGATVQLASDIALSSSELSSGAYLTSGATTLTIDLNGYTLSATTGSGSFKITSGSDVTIKGGTLSVSRASSSGTYANSTLISLYDGASLTLDSVSISAPCCIIAPTTNNTVTIKDSTLYSSGAYALSTVTSSSSNDTIYIYNSTLTADGGYTEETKVDDGGTAVMINVSSATFTIEGSTLTGSRQALVVRSGTASVKDSTLVSLGTLTGNTDCTTTWSGNNDVPYTTLVVGNKSSTSFTGEASVTLENTSLSIVTNAVEHNEGELLDLAYVSGVNGYNASLTYDSNTTGTTYTYASTGSGDLTGTTKSDIVGENYYADSSTTVTINGTSYTDTDNASSSST